MPFPDFVQKATSINTSGTSVTIGGAGFASNVSTGNMLFVLIRIGATGRTVTVTSDSTPASFVQSAAQDQTTDGHSLYLFHGLNQAGGVKPTVTINISGAAATIRAVLGEFVGSSNSHIDQISSGQADGSNSPSSGSTATRTDATELQLGGVSTANAETFTVGSGFTEMDHDSSGKLYLEYVTRLSTGTQAADCTITNPDNWACLTATFSDSAQAAPTTARSQFLSFFPVNP